ncbi:hypothetical protein [Tardiphaga sp. 768_D3_N2_1]|uniref:hypothetical protein n=1 Tax=Tardiphaga sp. 768_D3_N2_1 TaxID=3240783 RepID=UPI003F88D08F
MTREWLKFIGAVANHTVTAALCIAVIWIGFSQFYHLCTTGELLIWTGDRGNRALVPITYASAPFGFLVNLVINLLIAAFSLLVCVGVALGIRRWWLDKPGPPAR